MTNMSVNFLNLDSYAKLSKKSNPKNEKVILLESLINRLIVPLDKNISHSLNQTKLFQNNNLNS